MIGGIDVRLPSRAGADSLEIAVRAIRQQWPTAVFENGDTGDRYERLQLIPGDVTELFVYRNAQSADLWDEEGAVPETSNSMIHVIYDDGLITAVIDQWDAEMEAMIAAMRSNLRDPIHFIHAALREAA